SLPSSKAAAIAPGISINVFTFETPKLEPPSLGFTKQGNPNSSAISIGFGVSPLRIKIALAVATPKARKKLLHAHLLNVSEAAKQFELIYVKPTISKYACNFPSSPGVP